MVEEGEISSRGAEAIGSLGGNTSPTLHPEHYTQSHTHTPKMSGVAKSLGEGISFQYGLLPGAPMQQTGRPPLRDPLICDKSSPASSSSSSNFKIQFKLLQIAYWCFFSLSVHCTRVLGYLLHVTFYLIFSF